MGGKVCKQLLLSRQILRFLSLDREGGRDTSLFSSRLSSVSRVRLEREGVRVGSLHFHS